MLAGVADRWSDSDGVDSVCFRSLGETGKLLFERLSE